MTAGVNSETAGCHRNAGDRRADAPQPAGSRRISGKLHERVEECGQDESLRTIILRGAGDRAFSAGVDLHEMKDLEPLSAERFIRSLHAAARGVLNAPLPVVAAIHGPCLGGAFELALACDVRVAADDATFGLPEVRVGLPSVIEASLLPPTVGLGRARRMLLTGETVDARKP